MDQKTVKSPELKKYDDTGRRSRKWAIQRQTVINSLNQVIY